MRAPIGNETGPPIRPMAAPTPAPTAAPTPAPLEAPSAAPYPIAITTIEIQMMKKIVKKQQQKQLFVNLNLEINVPATLLIVAKLNLT